MRYLKLFENFDTRYNRELGLEILKKYLEGDKFIHSVGVADFAYKVSKKIKDNNIDIDPEFVGFLGYVHDIGYSIGPNKHEKSSVKLLVENEGIPLNIAKYVMHGQLYEQYEEIDENLPIGLEGKVLTYADMSVKDTPTSLESRRDEIIKRVRGLNIDEKLKYDIIENIHKAFPRFKKYEKEIFELSKSRSYMDFLK